jgi:hypothetical protein
MEYVIESWKETNQMDFHVFLALPSPIAPSAEKKEKR